MDVFAMEIQPVLKFVIILTFGFSLVFILVSKYVLKLTRLYIGSRVMMVLTATVIRVFFSEILIDFNVKNFKIEIFKSSPPP